MNRSVATNGGNGGAKSFLDRIFKPKEMIDLSKNVFEKPISIPSTAIDNKKTESEQPENSQKFNCLIDFKESLKQRMKAKRQQIRKEEEEDDMIDEEYHTVKNKETDNKQDGEANKEIDEDSRSTNNQSESCEEDEIESENDNEDDFKLNLMDDDEDEGENKTKKKSESTNKAKDSKKILASTTATSLPSVNKKKKEVYEFDDDLSDENTKSKKSLSEIPSTNSIPSNQLSKNFGLIIKQRLNIENTNTHSEFDSLDDERICLDGLQYDKRNSIDEMTNISFNYETNNNTTDSTLNSITLGANSLNQSGENNNNIKLEEDEDEEVVFDELAMLCSGQFKQTNTTKTKLLIPNAKQETENDLKEKLVDDKIVPNNDIYAAEEDEDDIKIKNKDDSDDSDFEINSKSAKKEIHKNRIIDDDEDANDGHSDLEINDIDDEEEDSEDDEDEIRSSISEKAEDEIKLTIGEKDEEHVIINKEDFIENEAELSGSEEESDENYDADSDEDAEPIMFSGDEEDLPSDSELKEQLGKIYLKDQMDLDKKQLRLIKEMYLADGELHQEKENRRKQFRWKSVNTEWNNLNGFSSDENEDDDEDGEEEEEETTEKQEKNKKFMKSLAERNWRSARHEREQFVHSKNKSETNDGLLSDDDDISKETLNEDGESQNSNPPFKQLALLKRGQKLLQNTIISKQQKRNLETVDNVLIATENIVTVKSIMVEKSAKINESPSNQKYLKKFSILNNGSYINRLTNYVNKNMNGCSIKGNSKGRGSNMIFASIDHDSNSNTDAAGQDNNKFMASNKTKFQTSTTKGVSINMNETDGPIPKRSRYNDTCESIFNHI